MFIVKLVVSINKHSNVRDIKVVRIVTNITNEEIDYKAGVVCGGDINNQTI